MGKLKDLQYEVMADLAVNAMELAKNPTKKQKAGVGAGAGLAALCGISTFGFAANSFFSQINKMLENLYGWILSISTGIAVVMLAWHIIKYMLAADPQEARESRNSIKRVIIAWVAVNLIGALATVVSDLTSGNSKVNFGK